MADLATDPDLAAKRWAFADSIRAMVRRIDAIDALGRSSVEWKLDGARIQAHRLGAEVRLFTRTGNDATSRLPSVAAVVAGLDVEAVVLDIDPKAKRFLLLKSRIHYRAGFAPIAAATVTCDGDGVTTSNNDLLRFARVRRPIYPLDLPNR